MIEKDFLGLRLIDEPIGSVVSFIESDRSSPADCKVLVTPNVDHFSRLREQRDGDEFSASYYSASLVVCDSRVIRILSRAFGQEILNVVPGSDLTKKLLGEPWLTSSKICVIGGLAKDLECVSAAFGLNDCVHYNPPMGFIGDSAEVEKCIDFIFENNPEYVFLAVGSPRQEILAKRIKERFCKVGGGVRFIFCIGASFDFLSGKVQRAPSWMQSMCLEWMHRAFSEPKRMIPRYFRNFMWICRISARSFLRKMFKI